MGKEYDSDITERWFFEHNLRSECVNVAWDGFTLVCQDTGEVIDEKPWAHIPRVGGVFSPLRDYYYAFNKRNVEFGKTLSVLEKFGVEAREEDVPRLVRLIRESGLRLFDSTIIMAWAVLKGYSLSDYKRFCKERGLKIRARDYNKMSLVASRIKVK